MKKLLISISLLLYAEIIHAQPYLDAVSVRYQKSPHGKTSPGANQFTYLNLSINIPLVMPKDSSIFVFSPFLENWSILSDSFLYQFKSRRSVALPVTVIKPLGKLWDMTLSLIPRWNGYAAGANKSFQIGAAVLATYKKRPGLHYKFGMYYNREFSGPFFMPLLGIDWQINEKNNLFGVLPGNLVFEHRLSKVMYWGASFRSITNSYANGYLYADQKPSFLRIQDTQADIFADLYLSDNIVFSLAAGHSFFRKYREGFMHTTRDYFRDMKMDAGFYGKVSFQYRIRFR